MFNSITWERYLSIITVLLAFYYTYIGIRYYRWELLRLIGIKKVEDNKVIVSTVAGFKKLLGSERHENELAKPASEADIAAIAKSFTDELRAFIAGSSSNISRHELQDSLKLLLSKYPVLKYAPFREELDELVFNETYSKFPELLQLRDVNDLWL